MHPQRSPLTFVICLMGLALACNLLSSGPQVPTPPPPSVFTQTVLAAPAVPTRTAAPTQSTRSPVPPTLAPALSPSPRPPTALAPQTWQPAGFGGAGNFDGVWFDVSQPGVVYAASDVTGVFRSTDYGDHWEMRSLGLGNYEISSFAIDPFDTNTLYAGAGAFKSSNKAGMYISHDAGLTWQSLPATFANAITFRRFRTTNVIAPDPAHRGVIISGSRESGLWRTTDGGLTWIQVYAPPLTRAPLFVAYEDDPPDPHPAPVSVVVFDPADPNRVYAGLDGYGILHSADGGLSWTPINTGLPKAATVKYLAVGPGQVLYAAAGVAGIYKSLDGGGNWQAVNGFGPDLTLGDRAWVSSVAIHPADAKTAYVTLATYDDANVWKTTDGGATWTPQRNVAVDPVNDPTEAWSPNAPGGAGFYPYTLSWLVTLDPRNSDRLFYVSYWAIVRSEDGGEHWVSKVAGAQNTCVTALAFDSRHPAGQPDKLFATHWDAGMLASTDLGASWTAVLPSTINDQTLSGHYWNLAIAPAGDHRFYYATADVNDPARNYGLVLRSADGIGWTRVFTVTRPEGTWLGGFILGLAVDPTTPTTLYALQDGGLIYKSTRSGEPGSWLATTGQPAKNSFTYALAVDAHHRIFAGTVRDGLWRSTNGGDSWQSVSALNQSTIFHLLAISDTVYAAGGDSNLYRSTDGGDTWQPLTQFGAPDDGDGVGNEGMAIAVDPRNPDRIFFSRQDPYHSADGGLGIVESVDGGQTWRPINAGLGNLAVSAMAVDSDGNLFAGTACGGIWRRLAGSSP